MKTERDFHSLLGETIKYCQCIEHDVKMIYAGMIGGNVKSNMIQIERETLGSAVTLLKELDEKRVKPFFSNQDYNTLWGITRIRNYWAHQGYIDYLYQPRETIKSKFDFQYNKLLSDRNSLKNLHEITQNVRLEFFKGR